MAGQFVSRRIDRCAILLYHRVSPYSLDAEQLCITPEHFGEHLSVIADGFRPIALSELVGELEHGRIPNRAVAVTFDDGYADNLEVAKPLLTAAGVPASVFVTTGYVGRSDRRFWWTELEHALLGPGSRPRTLTLTVGRRARSWPCQTRHRRRAAYNRLRAWLRTRPAEEINAICAQLAQWAGQSEQAGNAYGARVMTPPELRELERGGGIEIGAHTRSHLSLAAQPTAVQRDEIAGSKRDLEQWLGHDVCAVSYPYGERWLDYGPTATRLARESGFRCGLRNYGGPVTRLTPDRHQLPRVLVRDCDGAALAGRLERLFAS